MTDEVAVGDHASSALHMAAFADGPGGGNPAGVVLDASDLSDEQMLSWAAQLGYSESAFVTAPIDEQRHAELRFFTPEAAIPFCGHATVATAVALAERHGIGPFTFHTLAGEIALTTEVIDGSIVASFTSVEPWVSAIEEAVLARLLSLLDLQPTDLHEDYPPRLAFAGNIHPVLVLANLNVFDAFTFDAAAARQLMDEQGWAGTITVLHHLASHEFEARNIFPVGSIREDPATGSAAASTGAYLREIGSVRPPVTVTIRQGRHVGRPSVLLVSIPASGGITVTGSATTQI